MELIREKQWDVIVTCEGNDDLQYVTHRWGVKRTLGRGCCPLSNWAECFPNVFEHILSLRHPVFEKSYSEWQVRSSSFNITWLVIPLETSRHNVPCSYLQFWLHSLSLPCSGIILPFLLFWCVPNLLLPQGLCICYMHSVPFLSFCLECLPRDVAYDLSSFSPISMSPPQGYFI